MLRFICLATASLLAISVQANGPAEQLRSAPATQVKVEVVCSDDGFDQFFASSERLKKEGYILVRDERRSKTITVVGVGFQIVSMPRGALVVGAVPGSTAARSGLRFNRGGLEIIAVDGQSTDNKTTDETRAMIMGRQIPGTSVIVTFMPRNGGRTFDRQFERQRFSVVQEYGCNYFAPPKK